MDEKSRTEVAPWTRVAILVVGLVAAATLSRWLTGSIVPTERRDSLIFQSSLLLLVLGSAVIEHKFTRPADSVVNGVAGIVSLMTVYSVAPQPTWWIVFSYCALVVVLALVCIVVSTGPDISGWRRRFATITYKPAVFFGQARLLYSIVFLFGVFSFYARDSREVAVFVLFWGVFVAAWPLGLPQFLTHLKRGSGTDDPLGQVVRREWPDLVRVELRPGVKWEQDEPRIYQDADQNQHLVIPLYKQLRNQEAIATGLCVPYRGQRKNDLVAGFVYPFSDGEVSPQQSVAESLGGTDQSELLGFVIEESHIGAIRFETWRPELCRQGLLVWCLVAGKKVFYQITEGLTREETLQSDRLGSQYGIAAQVGILDSPKGFVKCDWLPTMNSPVFTEPELFEGGAAVAEGDFVYGRVPGTGLNVTGPFREAIDFHTAILGVTGSGKTELAFDLIRYSVNLGIKVVCIDLTARYEGRLSDLNARNLSLSPATAKELGEALFAAETGPYGAGEEKKALASLREKLYGDVSSLIGDFLTSEANDARVGIITLDEISNSKATLYVTELYMTCLLNYARDNQATSPQTLVVVEEAHTVMPETSSMGLGDYDSRGLVSKISQIALQGRKYRIGLLVIAQRTATVSKNVLTQCNTIISLNCFDETTMNFLANVYGRDHAEAIRDLPLLHAVVFGKGVRSERPIIVEIPFDPKKASPTLTG